MIPPKYKFYIGVLRTDVVAQKGYTISDSGEIFPSFTYNEAVLPTPIDNASALVFNYRTGPVGIGESVFFFDKNEALIQRVPLYGKYLSLIEVPKNARYYAARFTTANQYYAPDSEKPVIYHVSEAAVYYNKLSKIYERESGQQFFRQKLSGNINVFGTTYDKLVSYSYEDKLLFIVQKYNEKSEGWYDYFKGEFNLTDCKFNKSLKKCELKVTAIDDYSTMLERYEDKYDLIKLAPELTQIQLAKRAVIQLYIAGSDTVSNLLGGTYWEVDTLESVDSHEKLDNTYHFHLISTVPELFIKDALQELNGAYVGTGDLYFDNYAIKSQSTDAHYELDEDGNVTQTTFNYFLVICGKTDDYIYYKSQALYTKTYDGEVLTPPTYSPVFILGQYSPAASIEFTSVSNTSNVIYATYNTYRLYARILCDIEQTPSGLPTFDLGQSDFVSDNRNYKKCIGVEIGSSIGTVSFSSKKSNDPTRYGQDDNGKYFTPDIEQTPTTGKPIPICRSAWINTSFWFTYGHEYFDSFEYNFRKPFVLKDSYSIAAIIKVLLKKINPSLVHDSSPDYSQFLYGSSNPIGAGRFYVFLTQKTNILAGEYDKAAQKAEVSLKEIFDMLAKCFRLYWFIDNGKLRLEHISYFLNGLSYSSTAQGIQFDLTKNIDAFNSKKYSLYQTEIEFDKSELSSRYEFGWQDDCTDFFSGIYVDIISNYIQKDKKEEVNETLCSSDIDYMLISPENFSEDGFALICAGLDENGKYYIPIVTATYIDEDKNRYMALVQNYYASWAWLVKHYMYDMPAEATFCSATGYKYAEGVKRCMKSTVRFPCEEDLSVYGLLATEVGVGHIESMSIDFNSRIASVDLAFTPSKI